MTREEFKSTLKNSEPPKLLPPNLKALWYDSKGYWNKSHEIAQDIKTADGSLIHAYLHRKEGDLLNAEYWYRQAGRNLPDLSLDEEWEKLVSEFTSENE